jgi:hypothetical protein
MLTGYPVILCSDEHSDEPTTDARKVSHWVFELDDSDQDDMQAVLASRSPPPVSVLMSCSRIYVVLVATGWAPQAGALFVAASARRAVMRAPLWLTPYSHTSVTHLTSPPNESTFA